MVAFGAGEILGCFFIGYIVDKYGSKTASVVNIGIMAVMLGVTFGFLIDFKYNFLVFAMTFMWGFQDSATNTHCQEMLGFEFDNNSEPYAVYNSIQAVSCFIFQFIESYVNDRSTYIYYTAVVGFLGFITCGTTYFFDYRDRKSVMRHPRPLGSEEDVKFFHFSSEATTNFTVPENMAPTSH